MLISPIPLCSAKLNRETLASDKKASVKYESCRLGKNVLYVGGHYISNLYYIPFNRIERVYKRLAVSKGFFESGKVFITLSYLVVEYDGGKQKACRFMHEENLNLMLDDIRNKTKIPVGKKKK